jgi:hypothetical protein
MQVQKPIAKLLSHLIRRILARHLSRVISCILVIAIVSSSTMALAQFSPPNNMSAVSAREYYVGRDLGKPLITVHLLNGVGAPGVYHVPMDTDIAQLIAYAGGATDRADLSEITVRRGNQGRYSIAEFDLEKALKQPKDLFRIQDQDVVQIEQKFNTEKPLQWVGIISAVATIVMTFYLVKQSDKNN